NITGGHPSLVQTAGLLLWPQIQPGETADIRTFTQGFERYTQHIFQTIWTRCNRTEQALLMLIALLDVDGHIADKKFNLNGIERILSQLKRWLSELEDKGVIISSSTETGKFYSFTSPLMKKWVTEEILNTSDNLIRDREKEFLNLISHGQMRQVGEFISWLKNNPDTVKQCLNCQLKLDKYLK
ncbi:MAG: ATP-binding protein, partial [Dolichospermum sp.]